MPVDLHERLHTAVGDPAAATWDLDDAWGRGRRRRTARRTAGAATSAAAAVAVVMVGLSLVRPGPPDVAGPQVGPDPRPPVERDGWTRIPAGGTQPLDQVANVIDRPDEVEEIVRLEGAADWGWSTRAWDVGPDGTTYWMDAETHHVMARTPDGDTARLTEEPLTLFEDADGQGVVAALQVGPDGRLYLTAPSFESADLETGQTMVAIIDPVDGLVSLRHNDPTLLYGMVFADGYGWQPHGPQRWQPIAEMHAPQVLDGATRRSNQLTGELAPDGLALDLPQTDDDPTATATWTLRTRDEATHVFDLPWNVPINGYATPDSNPPSGERLTVVDGQGRGTTPSYLVRIDRAGVADVVGVDHTIAPGLEGIGNTMAVIGEDGYIYWTEQTAEGDLAIVRYTHRVREPTR